jgi:hypothetical protein
MMDLGFKNVWIRIQDEKMVRSRSGFKHPGSATLDYVTHEFEPVFCSNASFTSI